MKVDKPEALTYAEMLIALCDRFHVLPSQIEAEDASLLRALNLLDPNCGKAD